MMKQTLIGILLLCVWAGHADAQIVELNLPDPPHVEGELLSITFLDGVAQTEALQPVAGFGYTVTDTLFDDFLLWAAADDSLTAAQLAMLQADPRIRSVTQRNWAAIWNQDDPAEEAASGVKSIHDPDFSPTSPARMSIVVRFASSTSEAEAVQRVEAIGNVKIRKTSKRPNELFLRVKEGEDEAAVAALSQSPLVKYVAYF